MKLSITLQVLRVTGLFVIVGCKSVVLFFSEFSCGVCEKCQDI